MKQRASTSAITHAAKRARIERLSRVREFVLGAPDRLLVPLGVVTGMAAANPGQAPRATLGVGLTDMGAAVIPLWPYIVLPLMAPALITSIGCTLIAPFALGVARDRIARQAWQRAGPPGDADRKRSGWGRDRSPRDRRHWLTGM